MLIKDTAPGPEGFVVIGTIVKAQGIRGEVKVDLLAASPEELCCYKKVYLAPPDNTSGQQKLVPYTITACRRHGMFAILQLADITNRNLSETLQWHRVLVKTESLPVLEGDAYYWHELKGMRAVTSDGRELGKVSAFFETGAHAVLVMRHAGREYMVPARKEFIREVDRQSGTIVFELPPGLLEMND